MFFRIIAVVLLTALLLVVGATAAHTHSNTKDTHCTVEANAGHSHDGGCSLCSVEKDRVAVVDDVEVYEPQRIIVGHEFFEAQETFDRCPLVSVGRAPPVVR